MPGNWRSGRKPRPSNARVLRAKFGGGEEAANYGGNGDHPPASSKRSAPPTAPAKDGPLDRPTHLDAEAAAEWERLAPELIKLGLLTPGDRAAFTIYSQAWSYACWASRQLRQKSRRLSAMKNGGTRMQAAFQAWKISADMCLRVASDFGLTPVARSRIEGIVPPVPAPRPSERESATGTEGVTRDRHGNPV